MRAVALLGALALSACGGEMAGGSGAGSAAERAGDGTATGAAPSPDPVTQGGSAAAALGSRSTARARLTAEHLALLVAEGDPVSEQAARLYQAARGVPAEQVLRVRLPAEARESIGHEAFTALREQLQARLGPQVQALLVTWAAPSRVTGPCTMSITTALAWGYDPRHCGGCTRTTVSAYFDHDTARPFTDLGLRPTMMLGARSVDQAEKLIARGLAADGWMSGGARAQGLLVRTADTSRSVRFTDFQRTTALNLPGLSWHYQEASAAAPTPLPAAQQEVMFYLTGLARVPGVEGLGFVPGAVADHLTSTAGVLPDGAGQMPATAWLQAGATASYGTVEEPCNYVEKFPRASVLARRYGQGETLIEAYWKSVQWPGQGLFLGDPLARPWL